MLEFTNASPPITILSSALRCVEGPTNNQTTIYISTGGESHVIRFATHDEAVVAYQRCRAAIEANWLRQEALDHLTRLQIARAENPR